MTSKYSFGYSDDYDDGEEQDLDMTLRGPVTWYEVTEFYLRYLRAIGFVLSEGALLSYMAEKGIQYDRAVKEDVSDKLPTEWDSAPYEGGHDEGA